MEPTPAQLRVLIAIDDYVAEHRFAPTIGELAARVGAASRSGMLPHLKGLTALGLLTRQPRSSRAMALTPRGARTVDDERARLAQAGA